MGRIIKRVLGWIALLLIFLLLIFIWEAFPIISGYGAKIMCSDVFLSNRDPKDIEVNDLGALQFRLGHFELNRSDSTVTCSVWGMASRTAVYRTGLGAVLLNGIDLASLRSRHPRLVRPPNENQDSIDWPAGNRIRDAGQTGIDSVKLQSAIRFAFEEPAGKPLRRTRAIVIVYKGKIIGEAYAKGFSADTKQLGWSMTKSINNAMLGILAKKGILHPDDQAPVDEWQNDERKNIRIADLMHMSSGLKWWEFYAGPSDATNMLFKEMNMYAIAMHAKLEYPINTKFNYSSGTANLLSYIIRKKIPENEYYKFPYQELFYKIGMLNTILETDAGGTFVGSSYCYATPRDWARFGLLYLNDGVWNGERILPEGWVKFTTTPAPAAPRGNYGALWWLNAGTPGEPEKRKYPHVPADCYWASGYNGQKLFVLPSHHLVILRLSLEEGNALNEDQFVSQVIAALPQ